MNRGFQDVGEPALSKLSQQCFTFVKQKLGCVLSILEAPRNMDMTQKRYGSEHPDTVLAKVWPVALIPAQESRLQPLGRV